MLESKYNNLHTLNKVWSLVKEEIKNGHCDDIDIEESARQVMDMFGEEYINPKEYMNYDEALDYLGLGYNRGKLNALCKQYGIINHRIRNVPIGFKRKDIERLFYILQEENKKKKR